MNICAMQLAGLSCLEQRNQSWKYIDDFIEALLFFDIQWSSSVKCLVQHCLMAAEEKKDALIMFWNTAEHE